MRPRAMMLDVERPEPARGRLCRRASLLEVAHGRVAPAELDTALFGDVRLALPGEGWPHHEGTPMLPLLQLRPSILPFVPPRLRDIEFLTVFCGRPLPASTPNGQGWCLRTYSTMDGLVELLKPEDADELHAMDLEPRLLEEDYPSHDDIPDDILDAYPDLVEDAFGKPQPGLKFGGWPYTVQSEIFWAPHNQHPAAPEFVFQIDEFEEAGWFWGYGGCGYFGRGTTPGHHDEWFLEWQCM